MQEFFMDYGLWLLIALLVVIGLVFLLSGRKPAGAPLAEPEAETPPAPVMEAPCPAAAPIAPPASLAETTAPVAPPAPIAETSVVSEPVINEASVIEDAPPTAPVAPVPASPAVTLPQDAPDDLLKLKGVGPKLRTLLIELGVTRYAQIAAWTDTDIAAIDARLGTFKGRPVRDQWIDQAKYLAAGDIAGFEAKYGKL